MKHQLDSPYIDKSLACCMVLLCILSIPDDTQNLHVSLTTCEDFPEMTNDAEMDSDVRQRRNMKHQFGLSVLDIDKSLACCMVLLCVLSIPDDTQNLHVSLTTCEDFPEMTNDAEMDSDVRQRRNMKHQLDSPYIDKSLACCMVLVCVLSIPDDTQNLHVSLTTCEDFPEMTNDAEMDSDVRQRRNMKHQLDSPFLQLPGILLLACQQHDIDKSLACCMVLLCVLSIPDDTQNLHVSLTTCEDFPEMTNDAEMDSDVRQSRNMKHQLDSPFLQLPGILLLACQRHDIDKSLACRMVLLCVLSIPDDTQNLHVSLTTCEDFPEMTNDAEMDSDVGPWEHHGDCSVRLPCIILYHAVECPGSVDSSSLEFFSAKVVVFVSAEESSQDGAM